jgi:hypothetical protein
MDSNTITVHVFNTPLSPIDRSFKKKKPQIQYNPYQNLNTILQTNRKIKPEIDVET